jgi:hypothetical protein
MLRVYDARGEVVDGGLGYDVEDGYLDVCDSMLPPE